MKANMYRYLFLIVLIGCSTPKFYSEIKSSGLKHEVNNNILNLHKKVFNTLSNKLENSSRIIYLFSPSNKWNSKEFSGAVYDVDNDKYYYFENEENNFNKLRVEEKYQDPNNNYYEFIIDKYKKGEMDYLKKLGSISSHSGVRTYEVIYDVNLRKNTTERYEFQDFLFMHGKPTKDVSSD